MNLFTTNFALLCLLFVFNPFIVLSQQDVYHNQLEKGITYIKRSEYDSALAVLSPLAQETGLSPVQEITVNFEIATAHYYRGEYPRSIERILKSISLAEKLGSDSIILNTKRFAGEIYRASDNPEISKKYLEEALDMALELGDKQRTAYCLNRLGVIAYIYKDNDLADSLFSASMELCTKHNFMKVLSMNLNDLGELYFNQGRPDKSLALYQESLKSPLELDIKINTLNNMASALLKLGRLEEAIEVGLEAQMLADEAEILTLAERAVRIIADCYLSIQDFENGIIYYRKYMNYRGRLYTEQKDAQILELEKKYESERKQFLIDTQESKLALLTASNDFQQRMIVVVAVSLFLLFGLIYTYRSKRFAVKSKRIQEVFSQQLLTYQEEERKKISRDLHDSIGQSLILIKNKVQLKDEETGEMIASTLEEVRAISKQLHPVLLEKLGLTASIEKLVEEVDQGSEVFIESEITNIDGVLSKEQEVHLFRIIQETINNMLKHAEAVSASIKVEEGPNSLRYSIQDRGKGFDFTQDPSQFQSLGMQTLKERTKMLNGKLSIDSTVGNGTRIELIVPKPQDG